MRYLLLLLAVLLVPLRVHAWSAKRNRFNPAMIARYKGMLASRPDDGFAFRKLLSMYQNYSSLDRLIGEYRRLLKNSPTHYAHNVVLGRIYLKIDRFEEAEAVLKVARKRDPKRFEAFKSLGKLYLKRGKHKLARTNLDKALDNVKSNKRIRERLLRELVRISVLGGDIKGGTRYFGLILKLRPNDFRTRWDFAELLATGMHFKKAMVQYEKLYKMSFSDTRRRVRVMKAKGRLYEKMGKDQKAVAIYWKAMGLTARGHWVRRELVNRLVSIARRRDELHKLLQDFRRRWGSPSAFQYAIIGKIYSETGQFDKAIAAYRNAIRRDRYNVDYRLELIALLEKSGASPHTIITEQEHLARAVPSQVKYAVELASLYAKVGQTKRAMALTRRLLAQNPSEASLLLSLADLYAQWNTPKEVIKMYERLVRLEPHDHEHYINLGQQYWGRGNRKKAMKTWEKILRPGMFPKRADAYYILATVLMEVAKYAKAREYLRKGLKLQPNSTKFMYLDGQLLLKLRQLKAASQVFERTLAKAEEHQNVRMAKRVRKRLLKLWQELRILSKELAKRRLVWRPSKIDMGLFLAEGYTTLGKWTEAEKLLRAMRRRRPALSEPLLGLIRLYDSLGKYRGLITLLQEALRLIPHRAQEFYEQLSSTWALLGDDKKARHFLSLAIRKGAKDSKSWAKAGMLAIKLEDYYGAIKAYLEAIRLDPYEMEYYFAVASLYLQISKPKQATKVYRQIISRASTDELVERAGLLALDLGEISGELGTLERTLHPLSFVYSHRPVFSKLLLAVYKRYIPTVAHLKKRGRSRKVVAWAKGELKRLGNRALKPLLEGLTSGDLPEMNDARELLALLGNPNSAVPLIRMAKRLWEKGVQQRKKGTRTAFLSQGEFQFVQQSLLLAAKIGDKSILRELHYFSRQTQDTTVPLLALWGIARIQPQSSLFKALLERGSGVEQIKLACFTLASSQRNLPRLRAYVERRSGRLDLRIACMKALAHRGGSSLAPLLKKMRIQGSLYDPRHAAEALLPYSPEEQDLPEMVKGYLNANTAQKPLFAQALLLASGIRKRQELRPHPTPQISLGERPYAKTWLAEYFKQDQVRALLYPLGEADSAVSLWIPKDKKNTIKTRASLELRLLLQPPVLPRGHCPEARILSLLLPAARASLRGTIRDRTRLLESWFPDLSLQGFSSLCTPQEARRLGRTLYKRLYPQLLPLFSSPSLTIKERMWFMAITMGKRSLEQLFHAVTWEESRYRILTALIHRRYSPSTTAWRKLLLKGSNRERIVLLPLFFKTPKGESISYNVVADPDVVLASLGLEFLEEHSFPPKVLLPALNHPSLTVAQRAYDLAKRRHPKALHTLLQKLPKHRKEKLESQN